MHRKKGQSVLEFALVLPFFMFCIVLVAYTCIFFSEYFMVKNTVYDCTREAALKGEFTVQDGREVNNYSKLENTYNERLDEQTKNSIYYTDYSLQIKQDPDGTVATDCTLYLNDTVPDWLQQILPPSIDVAVQMHSFQ